MQDAKTVSAYRQALRERILDSAMHAFATEGIRAVKMDDIAQRLGISKRTLYEIYDNKELLLFEGVKKYKALRERDMMLMYADCANVMDMILRAYRRQVEEFKKTNPQFYVDIAKYPRVVDYLNQDREQSRQRFIDFMHRGVDEGYFRTDVNYMLVGSMFDAVVQHIMENRLYKAYSIETLFRSTLFVSLRGVCTQRGLVVLDEFLSNT